MTARSPAAFLCSTMLHAFFAAVVLYFGYMAKDEILKTTQPFEVVAGPGDNFEALEAPALGTPEGIKFDLPPLPVAALPAPELVPPPQPEPVVTPAPEPVVTPAPPEPTPVKAAPVPKAEPKVVPKTVAKAEPKAPDFVKSIKTTQNRIARKQKVAADKRRKEAELAAKRLSYQEFVAQQKKTAAAAKSGTPAKTPRIDAKGIAQGVVGGSTANTKGGAGGTALSRDEQDMLGTYFAMLRHKLKEAHEQNKPDGADSLSTEVEFHVAADGTISRARVTRSSGNTEYDQSVLAAFQIVRSVGRPRPDGRSDLVKLTFKMREADD